MRVHVAEYNVTKTWYAIKRTNESPEEAFVRSHDRHTTKQYRLGSYRTVSTGLDFAILDTTSIDGHHSTFTLTWRR